MVPCTAKKSPAKQNWHTDGPEVTRSGMASQVRLPHTHLRCFIYYLDKHIQFRNDAPECRLQSPYSTYGGIHTLSTFRICGSSRIQYSAVLDVFTSVDAGDFAGLGGLGGAKPDRYEPFPRVARFAIFRSQFQSGICVL
jgi:hypothetical protein